MIDYSRVERCARRVVRLIELGAPQIIVEGEVKFLHLLVFGPTPDNEIEEGEEDDEYDPDADEEFGARADWEWDKRR